MTNSRTSSRPSDAELRKHLKAICDNEPGTIPAAIAEESLKHDDPAQYLHDTNLGKLLGFTEDGTTLMIGLKKSD